MTEQDIMRDVNACGKGFCADCSRIFTDSCRRQLMTDAFVAMKMQEEVLENRRVEMEKLAEENRAFEGMLRSKFTEETLVEAVNDIIRDCYAVDWEDGDCYVQMLRTILAFGCLLQDKYKIVITGTMEAPVLVKE